MSSCPWHPASYPDSIDSAAYGLGLPSQLAGCAINRLLLFCPRPHLPLRRTSAWPLCLRVCFCFVLLVHLFCCFILDSTLSEVIRYLSLSGLSLISNLLLFCSENVLSKTWTLSCVLTFLLWSGRLFVLINIWCPLGKNCVLLSLGEIALFDLWFRRMINSKAGNLGPHASLPGCMLASVCLSLPGSYVWESQHSALNSNM